MKKREYPLKQIAEIKKRRLEEAEKILRQRRDAFDKAEIELKERRKLLNESMNLKLEIIEKHYKKIENGTTADIMERHDHYIKEVINVKIAEEKKRVDAQKKVVKEAEAALELAKVDRLKKNQDLEKIYMHEKEWTTETRKEIDIEEAIVEDELGSIMHSRRMGRGKQ